MPLTDLKIRQSKPSDKSYSLLDGYGLYLEIKPTGTKSWRYRYWMTPEKDNKITLGQYPHLSLQDARRERERLRELVKAGIDPAHERKAKKAVQKVERGTTLRAVSEEWIERQTPHWTPYYTRQVKSCLANNLYPALGSLPIKTVTPAQVLSVLRTMEDRGAPTFAIQLRQWISAIYRYAIVTLRAEADPSAPLQGAVKRPKVVHSKALTEEELRDLIRRLKEYGGNRTTVIAIWLILLTFVRTSELRQAKWGEFDFESELWTISAERMKKRRVHVVPLSKQALSLLRELQSITGAGDNLFPNMRRPRDCMSQTTINRALEYMGYPTAVITGHDMRATASTHLNEMGFNPDAIEMQLAHVDKNITRRSYNHSQYMDERTKIMADWANYLDNLGRD